MTKQFDELNNEFNISDDVVQPEVVKDKIEKGLCLGKGEMPYNYNDKKRLKWLYKNTAALKYMPTEVDSSFEAATFVTRMA